MPVASQPSQLNASFVTALRYDQTAQTGSVMGLATEHGRRDRCGVLASGRGQLAPQSHTATGRAGLQSHSLPDIKGKKVKGY